MTVIYSEGLKKMSEIYKSLYSAEDIFKYDAALDAISAENYQHVRDCFRKLDNALHVVQAELNEIN